ncbi:MAG: YggS family pyridoxal phosphate-dependent enzyme [Pseudomonadota bacterium]
MQRRKQINFNYQRVIHRIQASAASNHRDPRDIALLAVSKQQPIDKIEAVYELGQRDFGENYVQELIEKHAQLKHLDINWHFIGTFQSNKAADIAIRCHWLHSLTTQKGANKLNQHRPDDLTPLNCCIQVNLVDDPNKSGLLGDEALHELAVHVVKQPKLRLRGLMTIPSPEIITPADAFAMLAEKLQWLQIQLPDQPLDTLSMGMSGDLEIAIAHGSSMVRVGSALFGARDM